MKGPVLEANAPMALHVIRSLDPIKGGTSESVPALARATAQTGRFTNHLLQFGDPDETLPVACSGVPVRTLPWRPSALLTACDKEVKEYLSEFDIFHLHGIWEPQCAEAGRIARSLRRPYMVSSHGMLENWAVHNKRLKKQIYAALLERNNLMGAQCLQL